ncbi:hypothetical protein ADS79_04815 [Brevibacillus reuszeri]|uniref:Transmembrane protein n=1 Tax=Brevibacillus reuszeri TaxID=54915 RepID=A0A0K9YX35_9BACL|nr:hypothetical protein ADS79_04815 [Brevibacillus reuszeri]
MKRLLGRRGNRRKGSRFLGHLLGGVPARLHFKSETHVQSRLYCGLFRVDAKKRVSLFTLCLGGVPKIFAFLLFPLTSRCCLLGWWLKVSLRWDGNVKDKIFQRNMLGVERIENVACRRGIFLCQTRKKNRQQAWPFGGFVY